MKTTSNFTLTRRQALKAGFFAGAGMLAWRFLPPKAFANPAATGLSDPALQPIFKNLVPNALDPSFVFQSSNNKYKIAMQPRTQMTGLVNSSGQPLTTQVWGYGENGPGGTWPGMTFVAQKDVPVEVKWQNKLPNRHLLPVDTSLHWAYALPGYSQYTIEKDGVPAIPHLHGGHSDFQYDGNPEFFFSPGYTIRGPRWVDGIEKKFVYQNDQVAGTLWYHDHALGITRLNVYAGLAGFYILRDEYDTGISGNSLDLPVYPYEVALAIQDRMFTNTGALFYPAFPNEPFYNDFIYGEGANLPPDLFPGISPYVLPPDGVDYGGPTALAEFFGDHMLVNGKIWPKMEVEPRNYRLRLLNGCDSRFLAIQFWEVPAEATVFSTAIQQLEFTVIGSDQGLASSPTTVDTLLVETGSRYDIIFDFKTVTPGNRVILKNIGGDEPFGGEIPGPQIFGETDRIMAFDVVLPVNTNVADVSPTGIAFGPLVNNPVDRTRKVALFEGKDEFGRLQPLLGTAEPATDHAGIDINWPEDTKYSSVGLTGPMEGSIAWHSPTTENPKLGDTEEWEIWNVTGDAHPVHLHLVHFEVLGRREMRWDSNVDEDGFIPEGASPADDGIYLVSQPTVQHNSVAGYPSTYGKGFKIVHPSNPADAYGPVVPKRDDIVENTPKDMVTALPGQITRIKAKFDKPGRYVWHCHILSHEDHEMMRVLQVSE